MASEQATELRDPKGKVRGSRCPTLAGVGDVGGR
jgi:hypothetical protein